MGSDFIDITLQWHQDDLISLSVAGPGDQLAISVGGSASKEANAAPSRGDHHQNRTIYVIIEQLMTQYMQDV